MADSKFPDPNYIDGINSQNNDSSSKETTKPKDSLKMNPNDLLSNETMDNLVENSDALNQLGDKIGTGIESSAAQKIGQDRDASLGTGSGPSAELQHGNGPSIDSEDLYRIQRNQIKNLANNINMPKSVQGDFEKVAMDEINNGVEDKISKKHWEELKNFKSSKNLKKYEQKMDNIAKENNISVDELEKEIFRHENSEKWADYVKNLEQQSPPTKENLEFSKQLVSQMEQQGEENHHLSQSIEKLKKEKVSKNIQRKTSELASKEKTVLPNAQTQNENTQVLGDSASKLENKKTKVEEREKYQAEKELELKEMLKNAE